MLPPVSFLHRIDLPGQVNRDASEATPVRQSAVEFVVDDESVEGILASPTDRKPPFATVVVCHPHPLMGGNMESSVVVAVCRALAASGIASLRFDFRRPTSGEADPEKLAESAARDVAAAFGLVRRWRHARPNRCAAAGYSFGAAAIARSIETLGLARAFALIAPPVSSLADSALMTDSRPKLLVVGESDQLVSPVDMEALSREMSPPVSIEIIEGADHFFRGRADHVAGRVSTFLASALL